jgi:TonB family protein
LSQRTAVALLTAVALTTPGSLAAGAQQAQQAQSSQQAQPSQNEAAGRKVKSRVQPVYPDLARKMNIAGTVKVEVVVAPNGSVKDAKVVGGHPVLANAALDAARKWRFEPAAAESSGVIDFRFDPR